jgi:hypothetical protein
MKYHFNDGGRAAAGYKGKTGDCPARAMAIALGLDYKEVYKKLAQANADHCQKKSVRNGINIALFSDILKQYGWVWHKAPTFSGRKARCSDLTGTVIARQSKHVVTVIDGVPNDIWNSSNKMVYGYWAKT